MSDEELLNAARSGDETALERLLERHQARIFRFGLKMCRDPHDAEDVVQETLLAVARTVRDFRGGASMSTWLYGIARSFCIKKRRRSKFAPAEAASLDAPEAAAVVDPGRDADDELAARRVQRMLDEAIRSLEIGQREVLLLRDVEGLTAPEVAQVLGVSVQAVKSRLHRARLAVRERIAPRLGVASPSSARSCPDVVTLMSRHLEGEIGPEVCQQMREHVERCEDCSAACESLERTLSLCNAVEARELPPSARASIRAALREYVLASGER